MRRGTIVVIIFIIISATIIGLSQFLRAQPPLELTVAVTPLAERWARAAVEAFNESAPLVNSTQRVRFSVIVVEDMTTWQDDRRASWTGGNYPVVWIPATSLTIEYAKLNRLPVETVTQSLARTPLMWGGFTSRTDIITQDNTLPLDWQAVQAAAQAERWDALKGGQSNWNFVKLAFEQPSQSIAGLATLYSAAASFGENADLRANDTTINRDYRTWFAPIAASVPNFNTLGADPANAIASRGASVGEIALLPESRWLVNLDGFREPITLTYPAYNFIFDFPLARWQDETITPAVRQAVDALNNWLTGATWQNKLPDYGLRPANSEPTISNTLFANAEAYGVQLVPEYGEIITPPSRTSAQRLLQWFNTGR